MQSEFSPLGAAEYVVEEVLMQLCILAPTKSHLRGAIIVNSYLIEASILAQIS